VPSALTVPLAPGREALDVEALYRECRDDVYAYVATLLRDRGAAEDVVAQAFERALRKRRSFRAERGSPRAWLFGIARNAALDELRRGRSRGTAPLGAETADRGDVAEEAVRRATLQAALAALEPSERELVALKFHAGLDNTEIARVLGLSVSNAGTKLHRAVTKLREALDEQR
jgi:RNA polymerase sigma-70 factor (ECF subfamily)